MLKLTRIIPSRIVLAAVLLASPAAPAAADTDADTLLRHFESVVFGAEYAGTKGATQIQKWVGPIRMTVSNMHGNLVQKADGGRELKLENAKPEPQHVDMIRNRLTELVKLTGVKVEKRDKGEAANFFVKFVPRLAMRASFLAKEVDPKLLAQLAKPGVCYFFTQSIATGALFRATVLVNNELPPDKMDACILEELTQAFGLPNDSDIVSPSIFNQTSVARSYSKTDIILVKTLYDHHLPAGTPRRDALRIARELIVTQLGGG